MFTSGILPALIPRDAHSLWYTSDRYPNNSLTYTNPYRTTYRGRNAGPEDTTNHPSGPVLPSARRRAVQRAAFARSMIGRLRVDELEHERELEAIRDYGATHIRPLGINRTLDQIRDDQREAEELAEAEERDQAAQALAEAEAIPTDAMGEDADGDAAMAEDDENERDLDDDIPDGEDGSFGFDGLTGGDANEQTADSDDGEREDVPPHVQAMRDNEARMREVAAVGIINTRAAGVGIGDEDFEDGDQADIWAEDDMVTVDGGQLNDGALSDPELEADLDDEIPEASDRGYEHTDSDMSLTTDDYT